MRKLIVALLFLAGVPSSPASAQTAPDLAASVHAAAAAACGNCIASVHIVDPASSASWTLDFVPGATPAQQAQAAAALTGFDLSAWQAQQAAAANAAAAIAAGATITSTSTSALDGTYAIDPASQQKVARVALYIAVNGKFPAGQTVLAWADINGASHGFPTTAAFQAFATALGDYVTALGLGQAPALPLQIP